MAQIDWSQHPQRRDWAQPPHPHGRLQQLQHNFDVRNFTSHGWPGSVALPAATRRCRNLLPTHELSRLNPLVNHKAHLQDQSYLTTSDIYRQDCKYRDGAEAQLGQMHGAFAQQYHKHLNTALTSSMQGTILTSGSMQNNAQSPVLAQNEACGSTGLDDNFEYHIATMQPNHSTISSSTGQGNCNQSQLIGTAGVNLRLGNDGTPCHAGKCNKISINVPASRHNGGMQSDAQPVAMHNDSLTISDPKLSTSWLSSGGSQDLSTEEKEMLYRAAALQPISDLSAVCSSASADTEVVDKPKLRRNVRISKDPQSVAARQRRQRISSKMRVLQKLVPGGMKMDTASMLEEAAHYLKFLKAEVEKMEAIEQLMNVGKGHVDPSKLAAAGQMLQYAPQNQGAISKSNMHGVSNHNIIPASYQPASL